MSPTTRCNPEEFSCVSAFEFEADLQLIDTIYLNNGVRFMLQSENGYIYYMSLPKFKEYIKKNKVVFSGKFGFFQQGSVHSVSLVDET